MRYALIVGSAAVVAAQNCNLQGLCDVSGCRVAGEDSGLLGYGTLWINRHGITPQKI
jgi:hypothetical protein